MAGTGAKGVVETGSSWKALLRIPPSHLYISFMFQVPNYAYQMGGGSFLMQIKITLKCDHYKTIANEKKKLPS